MKTYAETQNEKPFDWNKALAVEPTEDQWEDMKGMASNWVTCACGNQCDVIPRDKNGRPYDDELIDLGFRFLAYVEGRWIKGCRFILREIEERSAYLINQIKK